MLDDFRGLLFLTTNRVGLIDEALKTRTHLALAFPRLSERATEMVWRDQIERAKNQYPESVRIYSKGIRDLVQGQRFRYSGERSHPWNARRIQNAFHASLVLAAEDSRIKAGKYTSSLYKQFPGDEAKPQHLTVVYKLRDAFESYEKLETFIVQPTTEYVENTVDDPQVARYIEKHTTLGFSRSFFLITGIVIARGA